jgi:hypothetical protein
MVYPNAHIPTDQSVLRWWLWYAKLGNLSLDVDLELLPLDGGEGMMGRRAFTVQPATVS